MSETEPRVPRAESPEFRILTAIRRIIRAVDIHSRKLSSQHHITAPQLVCLLELVSRGSLTISVLAQHVHLSPSTLVGIVDRLAAKGLVVRRRDERDRRRVLLSPTERGRELADHAPSPLQDRLSEGLSSLGEEERNDLAGAIERIVELLEARDLDAAPILETGPMDGPSSD
jgi:DNA-binding MarR family transcriptional regulator